MLRGEDVVLELADGTQLDVADVLVAQSDLSDQAVLDVQTRFINQARYKGDQDTLTLEWPKAEASSLIGAHVVVRGERYRVYGNPMPYADEICPTRWNRQVTAVRSLYLYEVTFYKNDAYQDEWGVMHDRYVGENRMCNLLRKTDDVASDGAEKDYAHILMFEMPLDQWDADYVALRYPSEHGEFARVSGLNYGTDTIVVTANGGVADAKF